MALRERHMKLNSVDVTTGEARADGAKSCGWTAS